MAWNAEYYDILNFYYWAPERLACARRKDLCDECRKLKPPPEIKEGFVLGRIRGHEEPLNHILNIFVQIAPQRMVSRLFSSCFGDSSSAGLEYLGREAHQRYRSAKDVTQPDIFLAGEGELLGVELKLGSKSSLEQVAKYALLFALEQNITGKREKVRFLLMTPEKRFDQLWSERFQTLDELRGGLAAYDPGTIPKPQIAAAFERHAGPVRDVLDRLEIAHVTYASFADDLKRERAKFSGESESEETVLKLIDGVLTELAERRLA